MQRLSILQEANMIDEQTHQLMNKVISYLQQTQELKESKMEVFITHLAMAVMRLKKGEVVDDMEPAILAEIEKSDDYPTARQIVAEIESWSSFTYAASEISYILLHLVDLLNKKGEK